jgi:hypothetical protein
MKTLRLLLFAACLGVVSITHAENTSPVLAQQLAQQPGLSMLEATAIVRRATRGRVVSASPTKNGGYKVRVVLDGGRVKTYKVDRNGRMK